MQDSLCGFGGRPTCGFCCNGAVVSLSALRAFSAVAVCVIQILAFSSFSAFAKLQAKVIHNLPLTYYRVLTIGKNYRERPQTLCLSGFKGGVRERLCVKAGVFMRKSL